MILILKDYTWKKLLFFFVFFLFFFQNTLDFFILVIFFARAYEITGPILSLQFIY